MLIQLGIIDYCLLIVYFVFVLGIGFVVRKGVSGTKDFFESGRALPAWICALGFLGANLGAQEVMGMAASGAKYGIMTSHFYWLGAVPAMVFVAVFMMPFYYGSKARSVPEYLKLRFDEKTRGFNAVAFACMTVMSSGISMYALATLLHAILGWNLHLCIVASGVVVLVYIFMGGLRSAIYNEVLQFFLIVFGFLPLVLLGLKQVGGWHGVTSRLAVVAARSGMPEGAWSHTWKFTGSAASNPMGIEWFGLAMGLGFVLSFGYWCTDFPGHSARHGGQGHGRRSADSHHRRVSEDALPGPRHPPRNAGHRNARGWRRALLAPEQGRQPQLRHGRAGHARPLLPHGSARARADGADCVVHVRNGGQRHRIQHRLDVRHLPELHP
jgi:hypothetical protein